MHLVVVTPERQLFEGEVDAIQLPGCDGELGILPGHQPLVTALTEGELLATCRKGEVYQFALHGGFAQITGSEVIILANLAEPAEEISAARAEAARQRAAAALQQAGLAPEERQRLEAKLHRAETRLRVAQQRRTGGLPPIQK